MKAFYLSVLASCLSFSSLAATNDVDTLVAEIEPQVIEWRRHFHQYPELSNREFKTAATIAKELKAMGLQVTEKVAHTGVIAYLDTGKPGPVVGLRADIDGLPVTESADLPFASKQVTEYNGNSTGVMHACGHDTHIAMLLGAAKVLTEQKDKLTGKIKFIFQPAEEGAPVGEEGGAALMVKEGVMDDVDVIFGLHISSATEVGKVEYRHGGIMAAVDPFELTVTGKQAHGAYPWLSVDPIVTSSQIVMALQTIVSRELPLINNAAVVTVGSIHGGNRSNIIPNSVKMEGTIRTLAPEMREQVLAAMKRKVENIAASMNAEVDLKLSYPYSYPVTYNEPKLMDKMLPTIQQSAGLDNVSVVNAVTGAEDFSFFQEKVPGLYLFVGGRSPSIKESEAPAHHTPEFYIDESGLKTGVKLLVDLTMDYGKKS